mmetsp:Transcript_38133/g.61898  ORF Transcript_38133/g.61898 Transcript_38133/m.61898 type:complete len:256 (+) Transcript_38133:173-940(+)
MWLGNFGREGGLLFAGWGANVALCDVMEGPLNESYNIVSAKIGSGQKCAQYACDITKPKDIETMIGQIESTFGQIDLLWNNAGYQGLMKPTTEYPLEDFAKVININVTGSFSLLQAVANSMISTKTSGSIVNTASVAALRGTPTMCAYVASKSAIIGMTMCTAKDLAPHNIRVNAVSPALIGPGFMWNRQNELHAASGSPYFDTDPDTVAKKKVASVPMKRLGTVEEVVRSVAFLLSDAAAYTTGTNLVIAGGLA